MEKLNWTVKQLENRDCAAFVYEYVMRHGGIKEANRLLDEEEKQESAPPAPPSTSTPHVGDVSTPANKSSKKFNRFNND